MDRPGAGAVLVQRLEVLPGDELAAVHAGLDGAESPQDAHLLHGAHHGRDVQPLQLGVDGVQPAHQVLQEEVEHLRQADQLLAVHAEAGHLHAVHLHQLALAAQTRAGRSLRQAGGARSQAGCAQRAQPAQGTQRGGGAAVPQAGQCASRSRQESAEHAAGEPWRRGQGVGVGVGVRRAGGAGGGDGCVERVRGRAVERDRSWGARARREERRGAGERHDGRSAVKTRALTEAFTLSHALSFVLSLCPAGRGKNNTCVSLLLGFRSLFPFLFLISSPQLPLASRSFQKELLLRVSVRGKRTVRSVRKSDWSRVRVSPRRSPASCRRD